MIRLFVALGLPEAVRERLTLVRAPLPGARWVPVENMHITLRFIGEVEPAVAEDIDDHLSRLTAPGFDIRLAGLGTFGSRGRVRALWAGVENTEPLLHLQAKIEAASMRAGLPAESRKFHPHVTLARCKNAPEGPAADFVATYGSFDLPPIPVDAFTLYASQTGRSGALYTPEAVYPLEL
ncbi:MAG: RNA 2',3'-cyclic phosphodiesterase [Alphaproteobacteria bacterium]|nr:RNA 2',3'-cyclic phosphodiesterase [Alphaproteobacteria bacterium]